MARKTMAAGLVNFDEEQGWRGAVSKLDISGDWGVKLADVKSLSDISPWRMAVVLETSDQSARIGFQPGRELGGAVSKERQDRHHHARRREMGEGRLRPGAGKTPTAVSQVLSPGDVIYADPLIGKDGNPVEGQYRLRQLPEISGAMVAMDPWTGRVLAMVGGFSFDQSQFNRATQAYRQPGSTVQADRLFVGARQRLYAVDRARSTRRSRSIRGRAAASGVRRTFRSANTTARRRCGTR